MRCNKIMKRALMIMLLVIKSIVWLRYSPVLIWHHWRSHHSQKRNAKMQKCKNTIRLSHPITWHWNLHFNWRFRPDSCGFLILLTDSSWWISPSDSTGSAHQFNDGSIGIEAADGWPTDAAAPPHRFPAIPGDSRRFPAIPGDSWGPVDRFDFLIPKRLKLCDVSRSAELDICLPFISRSCFGDWHRSIIIQISGFSPPFLSIILSLFFISFDLIFKSNVHVIDIGVDIIVDASASVRLRSGSGPKILRKWASQSVRKSTSLLWPIKSESIAQVGWKCSRIFKILQKF